MRKVPRWRRSMAFAPATMRIPATTVDPVCGMKVDPGRSEHRHEHAGTVYHFCCGGCRGKFAADPERYLAGKARRGAGRSRCHLHLPDAPGGPPGRPGRLPDLRHGAGARDRRRRRRRRTPNSPTWRGGCASASALAVPVVLLENGMHLLGDALRCGRAARAERLAAAPPGHAGRALGRLAVLPAGLGVAPDAATSTCSR